MHKKDAALQSKKAPLSPFLLQIETKWVNELCALVLARAQLLSLTSQLEALHPQIKGFHEGNGVKMMITSHCL